MTIKKVMLLATLIASFAVNNCTSLGYDATMRDELKVKSDKHISVGRPFEVTHEIKDETLTGEASDWIIWIPLVGDVVLTAGNVVGKIGATVTGALGGVPFIGEKMSGYSAASANLGPYLANFMIPGLANKAESQIVFDKNIDGFFRTGVHAEINVKYLIIKEYKVVVTGKPIVIKALGIMTPERLAKIAAMATKAGCTTCADVK